MRDPHDNLETDEHEDLEMGPRFEPMPFGFPPRRVDAWIEGDALDPLGPPHLGLEYWL